MTRLVCLILLIAGVPTAGAHEKMVEVFAQVTKVETDLEHMPTNQETVLLFFVVDDHTEADMDPSPEVGLYPNSVGVVLRSQTEDIDLGRAELRMESGAGTSRVVMTGTHAPALGDDVECAGGFDEETGIRTHECATSVEFVVNLGEAVGTSSEASVEEATYSQRVGQELLLWVDRRECDETVSPEECVAAPMWRGSFQVLGIRVVAATSVEDLTWGSLKARHGRD